MKVIRSARLWKQEGASRQIYEVELVDLETVGRDSRFLVNFRTGRSGSALREGTKTVSPVMLSTAQRSFDSVVLAKVNDGYRREQPGQNEPVAALGNVVPPEPTATVLPGREAALLAQLTECLRGYWPQKRRDRLLWRLGVVRVTAATAPLLALARTIGARSACYSLVPALARCCGGAARSLLEEIAQDNISSVTRDYAAYALASELMGDQRQRSRRPLPQARDGGRAIRIEAALAAADGPLLVEVLCEEAGSQPGFANRFLIALAHQALAEPAARAALLAALRVVDTMPPFVQVLRRVLKYADLTDDAGLFAVTARQFDLASAMYSVTLTSYGRRYRPRLVDIRGEEVDFREEQAAPDPWIALSDQTLLYLRRRAWRMLRKRGELGQDAFTAMAAELLLAFTDDDERGADEVVDDDAVGFRELWSFSHILFAGDPSSTFSSWTHYRLGPEFSTGRGEAFPALWDAKPRLLLRIAAQARNRPAALFAVKALTLGPDRSEELDAEALPALVTSPYLEVQQFADRIARAQMRTKAVDPSIVVALCHAGSAELRELAIAEIGRRSEWPWADPALALALLTSPVDAIQNAMRGWLGQRAPTSDQRRQLVQVFAAWLESLGAELATVERDGLRFALSLLPLLWPDNDCPLAGERILQLTGHPAGEVQAAALHLLAVTELRQEELKPQFWQAILNSARADVRAAAMLVLARLDTESLSEHSDAIGAAALSAHAELRHRARPLAIHLAGAEPGFAERLRSALMTALFQGEPAEGHGADMAELFIEGLPQVFAALDRGTLWRLLQARARGARLLGARALETVAAAAELSVRQMARLGSHPYVAVRRWAMARFEADEPRFRAEAEDAVLLVESSWEDVWKPAMARLSAWPEEALSPAALAVMADSTVPEVQDAVRQLLRRRLGGGDAAMVLARLLEHPASGFHLFVTELISAETLSDPSVFEKFLVQARIILMQVHRGRAAKDRVLAVLRSEALARADRAAAIWRLLHDLTLSAIRRDKHPALMILRDIARSWPEIAMHVTVTPLQQFEPSGRETAA